MSVAATWNAMRFSSTDANPRTTAADSQLEQKWRERRAELLRIRQYPRNWDGAGSDKPQESVVDRAIDFLRVLKDQMTEPPTACVLSPGDGTILMIWRRPEAYLEAEVSSSSAIEWMRKRGKAAQHWTEIWPGDDAISRREISWEPKHLTGAGGVADV